jgi:hypothetical protein
MFLSGKKTGKARFYPPESSACALLKPLKLIPLFREAKIPPKTGVFSATENHNTMKSRQ